MTERTPWTERPTRRGRAARSEAPAHEAADLGPEADAESVARTILLNELTGRARTRHELAKKLAAKGVPDDLAAALLDRFEEVGLIDDAAFARDWVESRQSGKGLARRALSQELRRKGIDDDVAIEALDARQEEEPDAEMEAARMLVRRKLRSVGQLDPAVATRRLVGMLARKGHGPGVAYRVVKEELAGAAEVLDDMES